MTLLISSAKFFKCQGHKHGQNWGPLLLKIDELWINDDLDQEDLLFKLLECFACSRGKFPHDLQLLVEIYCELWNTQIKSIKVIPKLRELVNDVGCGRQIVYWGQKGKNENSTFAYWSKS